MMMASNKEFLDVLKEGANQGYAWFLKPTSASDPLVSKQEDTTKEVLKLLEKYKGIVVEEIPNSLPPIRDISHQIDLILGATLPNKFAYKMTPSQNEEISRQVLGLLDKGLVRKSLSPCFVPRALAPKKDGKWRLCTNSRAINRITIRYRFLMPHIEDLMDCLGGACYYSKIDLKSGYNQIRIRQGDEWKTTFKTNEGLYKWLVLAFLMFML